MYTRELGSSGLCAAENGAKWAPPSRQYADPATGPGNSHRLTHIPHLLNKPTRRPRNREGADQGAEATPLLPSSSRQPFPSPFLYRALPRRCSGSTTSQPAPTERPRRRRGTPPTTTTQPWKTTTMWLWNTTNSRPCAANRHATVIITNRPRSATSPARKRRISSRMAGISGRRLSVGAAAPGIEITPITVSQWRARDGRRCWRCSSSSSPRCWVVPVAGRRGISFLRGRASRAAATVGADWGARRRDRRRRRGRLAWKRRPRRRRPRGPLWMYTCGEIRIGMILDLTSPVDVTQVTRWQCRQWCGTGRRIWPDCGRRTRSWRWIISRRPNCPTSTPSRWVFRNHTKHCIVGVPRCSVTFWTHPEIIPVGQFFRRWIKSINQA